MIKERNEGRKIKNDWNMWRMNIVNNYVNWDDKIEGEGKIFFMGLLCFLGRLWVFYLNRIDLWLERFMNCGKYEEYFY